MTPTPRLLSLLALVALTVLAATGCTPVVRDRTLPPSVRSVHVPMIVNRTQQPGLEERLTVAFQRELLADGRLDVVKETKADAIVRMTIDNFDDYPAALDADGFGVSRQWDVRARMEILENIPGRPSIGGVRKIKARWVSNDDSRTTTFTPESREIEELATIFGREALLELITGEFEEIAPELEEAQGREGREMPTAGIELPR